MPLGFQYCLTQGVLELLDYVMFFRQQDVPVTAKVTEFLGGPRPRES